MTAPTTGTTTRVPTEGVVRHMMSDRDDCICCDGNHVFSYYLEATENTPDRDKVRNVNGVLTDNLDYQGVIHRAFRKLPEGTRVRIDVTVVE